LASIADTKGAIFVKSEHQYLMEDFICWLVWISSGVFLVALILHFFEVI
jgi:hypothetical protein